MNKTGKLETLKKTVQKKRHKLKSGGAVFFSWAQEVENKPRKQI